MGAMYSYTNNNAMIVFEIWVDGISIAEEEKKEYEWLEEREKPESLQVIVKMYSSPKIVEN